MSRKEKIRSMERFVSKTEYGKMREEKDLDKDTSLFDMAKDIVGIGKNKVKQVKSKIDTKNKYRSKVLQRNKKLRDELKR